jgi:hypothetical protein
MEHRVDAETERYLQQHLHLSQLMHARKCSLTPVLSLPLPLSLCPQHLEQKYWNTMQHRGCGNSVGTLRHAGIFTRCWISAPWLPIAAADGCIACLRKDSKQTSCLTPSCYSRALEGAGGGGDFGAGARCWSWHTHGQVWGNTTESEYTV